MLAHGRKLMALVGVVTLFLGTPLAAGKPGNGNGDASSEHGRKPPKTTTTTEATTTTTTSSTTTTTLPPSTDLSVSIADAPRWIDMVSRVEGRACPSFPPACHPTALDPVTQDYLRHEITVTNLDTTTATSVTLVNQTTGELVDLLNSPKIIVTGTDATQGTCAIQGTTVTCDLGTLEPGASATVIASFNVCSFSNGATAGTITSNATVSAAGDDPVPGNNADDQTTDVVNVWGCAPF